MKGFYIEYKDGTIIEGVIHTDHKSFVDKIIIPQRDIIENFNFYYVEGSL